jgi:hypothetical protein
MTTTTLTTGDPGWCCVCGRKVKQLRAILSRFRAGARAREHAAGSELCARCALTILPDAR